MVVSFFGNEKPLLDLLRAATDVPLAGPDIDLVGFTLMALVDDEVTAVELDMRSSVADVLLLLLRVGQTT